MRNHSRCVSFLLSGLLSVSLLAPLSSAQAAYDDGSIRDLVDRVTVLTESVQTESANEDELAKLDEMQAELEDKADAKEDVSATETVSMVVTGRHDQRAHGSRHELRQDHAGGQRQTGHRCR